jgi:hypothetical protein
MVMPLQIEYHFDCEVDMLECLRTLRISPSTEKIKELIEVSIENKDSWVKLDMSIPNLWVVSTTILAGGIMTIFFVHYPHEAVEAIQVVCIRLGRIAQLTADIIWDAATRERIRSALLTL